MITLDEFHVYSRNEINKKITETFIWKLLHCKNISEQRPIIWNYHWQLNTWIEGIVKFLFLLAKWIKKKINSFVAKRIILLYAIIYVLNITETRDPKLKILSGNHPISLNNANWNQIPTLRNTGSGKCSHHLPAVSLQLVGDHSSPPLLILYSSLKCLQPYFPLSFPLFIYTISLCMFISVLLAFNVLWVKWYPAHCNWNRNPYWRNVWWRPFHMYLLIKKWQLMIGYHKIDWYFYVREIKFPTTSIMMIELTGF